MDALSEEQYELTLRHMQEHNEESFQEALSLARKCNFDWEAIKEHVMEERAHLHHPPQEPHDEHIDDQELNKIKRYLLRGRRPRHSSQARQNRFTACLKNMCMRMTETLVPEIIKRKVIRSQFYQLYQDDSTIYLKHQSLEAAVSEAKKKKKKLIVIVSENAKNHCIVEFLRRKKLLEHMERTFQIVGIVQSQLRNKRISRKSEKGQTRTSDISSVFSAPFEHIHAPCVLALRERLTQDLEIIENFQGETAILSVDLARLGLITDKAKTSDRRESAILRQITQKMYLYGSGAVQQQEETIADIQAPLKQAQASSIIRKQNEEYKVMEQRKLEQEANERRKCEEIEQLIEERNCRKMSLPEEPRGEEGEEIIKIIFRCPNGDNLPRKFHRREKCELLFNWVELNDTIEFEGDDQDENKKALELQALRKKSCEKVLVKARKFDLMYSYPPESLRSRMEMELGQIFEGEEQVKILIREQ